MKARQYLIATIVALNLSSLSAQQLTAPNSVADCNTPNVGNTPLPFGAWANEVRSALTGDLEAILELANLMYSDNRNQNAFAGIS